MSRRFSYCADTAWEGKGGAYGVVVRALASHQCGPGANPRAGAICGLRLLLVLSFAPMPEVFVRVLRFSPLLKNQHFQFLIGQGMVDEEPLCGCATSKY